MENEVTPKQALKELEEKAKLLICNDGYVCDLVKPIYQALTELEETKVLCESFKNDANRLNEQCINLYLKDKKQTEILEVLKNKVVAKERIKNCENVNAYNNYVLPPFSQLTETEFNLIKEWLNNGKC